MKIKEQTIKELDGLRPTELLRIYDMILSLKDKIQKERGSKSVPDYIRIRKALKQCKGSLREDILRNREERI